MALSFVEHEDVVFERAPLTVVLCQAKFPPIMSLMAAVGVTGFQSALRDEYPHFLPVEVRAKVSIAPDSLGMERSAPVWKMTDATKSWTVGLAADFVSLETPSYTDIGEFLERFGRILTALRRTIRPATSIRIGLRKVNELQLAEPLTRDVLMSAIRPELLGVLAWPRLPARVVFNFNQTRFADEDNILAVQYGLHPKKENTFVIDLDYFTERPYELDGSADLLNLLQYFSKGMTSFFHWAITPEYKHSIGPKPKTEKVRHD